MMAFDTNINTKLKTRVYELYEPFEKGLEKIIVGESTVHREEENKIDNTNHPIWQSNTVVGGILTGKLRKNKTVLPLEDDNPWVMQIFVQDDLTLLPLYKSLKSYHLHKFFSP